MRYWKEYSKRKKIRYRMSQMDENVNQKNEKCELCYRLKDCMLAMAMTRLCGGPWKDAAERSAFVRQEILGIKKK